jgi:RimJ/RimL family protein N-acetyltransferase
VFEVETARLSLRSLSEDDETLYCDLYADAETMRFIGPPLSRERAADNFRITLACTRRQPLEHVFLTLVEKDSRQTIGICSLQQFDAQRSKVEAGIMLRPARHTQGFAKEGFAALITAAFAIFPIDEVRVQIAAANSAAERVAVSLGLSRCGAAAASEQSSETGIWSTHRGPWCQKTTNREENDHVERHRLS